MELYRLLLDSLKRYHALFKLDETPDHEQEVMLDRVGESKREAGHGCADARCQQTDESGDADDEG